jgi:hypothetical protein
MELFTPVQKPFANTKVAATPLDEDSAKWSSQILQELFRQVPEASEYNPKYVPMRQDPEQGFSIGVIVISAQTDSALSNSTANPTSKKALIPVIIKNNELCPLDLVMSEDKRLWPLNGQRLREVLFRPNTFDMMTNDEGDGSLYSMFYPPGRSSNTPGAGMGNHSGGDASYIMGPGMKMAQLAERGLLAEIAPTLSQIDLDRLTDKIAAEGLQDQLSVNPAFLMAVSALAQYDGKLLTEGDPELLMDKAASIAPVEVAQFGYDAARDRYWMKAASRTLFNPDVDFISRRELVKLAGEEIAKKVDMDGTTTVAAPVKDVTPLSAQGEEASIVQEAGVYKVRDTSGQEHVGWVIPQLIDFDGTRLPMTIFTDGKVAAVQESIVGSSVPDDGIELPNSPPKGSGVFYVIAPDGIQATVPMRILGVEASMDGSEVVHAVSLTGEQRTIRKVEGLQQMMPQGEEVMLPASAGFLSLENELAVPLIDGQESMKQASLMRPHLTVRSNGSDVAFSFYGLPGYEQSVPKTASYDEAVFTLCVAGLTPVRAHSVLKTASLFSRPETIVGVQDVRPLSHVLDEVQKIAEKKVAEARELRRDLVKEASILPDIQTVDSVLSLGFINPENIRTFVGKLPYLDRALNTLCELTLLSRLGMSEVPEFAAARACRAVDEVVQGLKALGMRSNDEQAPSTS